jgi:hypothetical protein
VLFGVENGPLSIGLILVFGRIKLKLIAKKVCISNVKQIRIDENVVVSELHRLVLAVDCYIVEKQLSFDKVII